MPRYNPQEDIDFLRQKMNQLNEDILPSHRISPKVLVQRLDEERPALAAKRVIFTRKRVAFALCAAFMGCIVLVYAGLQPVGVQSEDSARKADVTAGVMGFASAKDESGTFEAAPAPATDAGITEAPKAEDGYQAIRTALEQAQTGNTREQQTQEDGIPGDASIASETHSLTGEVGGMGSGGGAGGAEGNGLMAKALNNSLTSDSGNADIVQTDGKYIYFTTGTEVKIAETSAEGKLTFSSEIDVSKEDRFVIELFQQGNTLTLLCNNYAYTAPGVQDASNPVQTVGTTVEMYDITNRNIPVKTREFTQEGEYLSAKVSGDVLYMVSVRKTFEYSGELPVSSIVPSYYDSALGMGGAAAVSPKDIILTSQTENSSYATVTALKLYDAAAPADTKAVLGGARGVYCAQNNVYLVNTVTLSDNQSGTQVTKLSFSGTSYNGITEGRVAGRVPEGLALDEAGDTLRIATTSQNQEGKTAVNLYVLNSSLSIAGSVTGVHENQTVYAVRYYGNTAYVSAYGEQDPLLVFDLSDAARPKLLSDVKAEGFSTCLHRVGEQLMAGLGYLTAQENGRTVRQGLKLTLFDISDKQKPVVQKAVTLGESGSYSEAVFSVQSLYYSSDKQIIGFPAAITRYQEGSRSLEKAFGGYYVYSLKSNTLTLLGKAENVSDAPEDEIRRGICIGNSLYVTSANSVSCYDLDSFNRTDMLQW